MKKTYKSSLLALSVLASFTSCSESESLQQANLSKDKITFHATLDNSWKPMSPASSSRAAIAAATEKGPIVVSTPFGKPLYLHPVVQDGIHIWSKEGKPITRSGAPLEDVEHERVAQTRGTMSTKIGDYGSFGVTAIYKEGENNVLLLDNAKAEKTDGEFWGFTNNSNARWPIGATVSFHAYAPHSSADKSMLTYGVDKDHVQTQITYTASTTEEGINNQPDLIVATNTGSRQLTDAADAVQLNFYHALTAVSFAIDKDLADVVGKGGKMTSVTLKGIPNKGNCNLSVSATANVPTADWTVENERVDYTFDLTDKNIIVGEKDQALTSDNQTLMMIPQTLPEGAELCFNLEINGATQEWKVPLKGQVWEAGKSIIYKLSSNSINMLDDAKIVYPSTWTAHSFPKKSFGENDVVGLYVVNKFNQIVAENVQLTKTKGEENAFTWKTKDNKNFSFSPYNKYFAYYPYNATAPTVDETKDNADEFFKDMITNWTPVKEQKTEDVLLSQDLQVGEGVIDGDAATLTFNMAHSMGLAVLNLETKDIPKTRRFVNNNYTYYYPSYEHRATTEPTKGKDYTDDNTKQTVRASSAFLENIPYPSKNTEFRYFQIVKPSTDVSFKASDESGKPRSAWGTLTPNPYTLNVAKNTAVSKSIITDADFYFLARKYDCTQSVETFTALEDGTYTLECWGAQGGPMYSVDIKAKGGGYTIGSLKVDKGKQLFVCVGGQGGTGKRDGKKASGGYNGGGKGGYGVKNEKGQILLGGGGGGGATHIAFTTGVLTQFVNSYSEQLLMVAGGAAGFSNMTTTNYNAAYGGGLEGGRAYNQNTNKSYGIAGQNPPNGMFGQGQNGRDGTTKKNRGGEGNSGGGGGFCGGYSDPTTGTNSNAIGGGGSGYVNTKFLTDATTTPGNTTFSSPTGTKELGHQGDGAAVISWFVKEPSTTK